MFAVVAAIVLVCIFSVFLVHKWKDRQEARSTPPVVDPALQRDMQKEAFLLAVLLIRAGSERTMEKELPSEVEVITVALNGKFLFAAVSGTTHRQP